jgi:PAS domain S-box-containing protein
MFEASAVGIAVLDRQHRFAAANAAFQKMIGYTGEELQSLSPPDITHEEDREATQGMIEDVQSGKGQDTPSEKRYHRKDGKVIWVRVSAARALDSNGALQSILAIIEDITERKRAELDLHDAREALSRATRLTMMGELSASIAHEINQPLGAIIMKGNACQRFLAITPPDLDEVKDGLEERWQSRHREPLKRQSVTAPNACALFGRRKLRVSASTPTLPSAHPSIYANDGPRSRYHNACIGRRGFLPRASRSDAPS